MTRVYNYFALPPAHDYFCDAALQLSQEAMLTPPADTDAFALAGLPRLEAAFERFFQEMERYRVAVAEWDARYGYSHGLAQNATMLSGAAITQPYGVSGAVPLSTAPAAYVQGTSGYAQSVSQPVVQPIAGAQPSAAPPPAAMTAPASDTQTVQTVSQPVVQAIPGQAQPAGEPPATSVSVPVVQPIPEEGSR